MFELHLQLMVHTLGQSGTNELRFATSNLQMHHLCIQIIFSFLAAV